MTDLLDELFRSDQPKQFVGRMKKAQEEYSTPQEFIQDVAGYLPVRLYEHFYDDRVPGSFFGLATAFQSQSLFSQEHIWLPFVQQGWLAAQEKKRSPWDLDQIEAHLDASPVETWAAFEAAAEAGQFSRAFAAAKGLLAGEESRTYFRERSLTYAMHDSAHYGQKFSYLLQAWRLAEGLGWTQVERILFAPLHYLVTGPRDRTVSDLAKEFWRENPLPALLTQSQEPSPEVYRRVEQQLLFAGDSSVALDVLVEMAEADVGLEQALDALGLVACQALVNSRPGSWKRPLAVFHFCCLSRQWLPLVNRHRRTFALALAAVLVHDASRRSRDRDDNRTLDSVAKQLCPTDTFNVLRSVVSHSDPYASATAVYAILGMDEAKKEELFKTLAFLATKNDGRVCAGNDLLLVQQAVDSYQRSQSPRKGNYLVATAFFLARIPKRYELFVAYGLK